MAEFREETERLILRDWREEDWAEFWRHTNTPDVMRWLGGVADGPGRSIARKRLEDYRSDYGHTMWVVERKADTALLGFCGLKRSNQAGGPIGMMEVGWRLRQDAWGHGYAKEAAIASLDLAFNRFAAEEVIALTITANTASWGLMQRLGMKRREDLDFASDDFDAEEGIVIAHSITGTEWKSADG